MTYSEKIYGKNYNVLWEWFPHRIIGIASVEIMVTTLICMGFIPVQYRNSSHKIMAVIYMSL